MVTCLCRQAAHSQVARPGFSVIYMGDKGVFGHMGIGPPEHACRAAAFGSPQQATLQLALMSEQLALLRGAPHVRPAESTLTKPGLQLLHTSREGLATWKQ